MRKPDYFRMDTEDLNAAIRTAVDALRRQIYASSPAVSDRLRCAAEALNEAAVEFTDVLYTEEVDA